MAHPTTRLPGTSSTAAGSGTLAWAAGCRQTADAAEAELLQAACQWADEHPPESITQAATLYAAGHGDTGIPIAGPGAGLVAEFCIAELAAVLGMSTDAGQSLVGEALELRDRLPKLWARVQGLELPAWRGRRIARQTMTLSFEAAGWLDTHLAPYAHRCGPTQVDRLVTEALARFQPADLAAGRARSSAERSGQGHARGEGSSLPRRQRDQHLHVVKLHVHLTDAALQSLNLGGCDLARVEEHHQILLANTLREQLATWLDRADLKVHVVPVIDLNQRVAVDSYEIPDRLHEQVTLRDHTCMFPWCNRPARRCDLDHTDPFRTIDDTGPPGQTSTANLAPLCRRHHRLKTFGGWTYLMLEPGRYLWTDPHGQSYLRDHTGTTPAA